MPDSLFLSLDKQIPGRFVVFARIVKVTFCLAVATLAIPLSGLIGVISTDYQQELATIEYTISTEFNKPGLSLSDPKILFQKAYYYFLKSSLTGSRRDRVQAERHLTKRWQAPASSDLYLLHAAFNLKLHRLEAAKTDLQKLSFMDEDPKVQVLKADIDVQEGNYRVAETSYQNIMEKNRLWDNLSRLAYLRAKFGDFESADQLYLEAEEEISAKEMRSYAWVELQRGFLDLSRGRHEAAWDHYQQSRSSLFRLLAGQRLYGRVVRCAAEFRRCDSSLSENDNLCAATGTLSCSG